MLGVHAPLPLYPTTAVCENGTITGTPSPLDFFLLLCTADAALKSHVLRLLTSDLNYMAYNGPNIKQILTTAAAQVTIILPMVKSIDLL